MNRPPERFIAQAERLLGPRGFTRDPDLMKPWLTDWRGRYSGAAIGMASPASTAEVAALVRLCAESAVPIVPQGGNSGMSGGATPSPDGRSLLLSLRRMNAVRALDVTAGTIVCEAGVILQSLHVAAEGAGLRFPLTLGGKGSATVGGLISTNAGGTQVLRHGSMREQVLGLEAVLADGSVWSALTPLKKDNRGIDLKHLLIGAEGTLGIVTAATLRLSPAPTARCVAWIGLSSLQQARSLLTALEASAGAALEGFEVLPQSCLDAVLAYLPDARSPLGASHPWHALIELVGDAPALLAEQLLADAAALLNDAVIAQSEAQADAFWLLRESISPAERAKGPAMQHDIAVPVALMADFVDAAVPAIEARWPGTRAFGFGHLGDGNVHFHVQAPPGSDRESWEADAGKEISRAVHDLVSEWHGTISAEHGIGQMKVAELARLADPVSLDLQRRIKQALDPQGLMNPGKLLAPAATTA
ncbi:MAG TPA: FAD-binding oxidoreductase [Novosphingobium sp.]|nr:FAD-binding oxidoreductase [Novosphingobium sp.]